jgi:DNA-binding beta-propeller fold protein YncE
MGFKFNALTGKFDLVNDGGTGSSTFIGLSDVDPTEYTGQAGKIVQVNSTADGLEFGTVGSKILKVSEISSDSYSILTDDEYISVTYTDTDEVTITIPTAQNIEGRILTIADDGFNCFNNNIILTCEDSGTKINNSTSDYIMDINGSVVRILCYDATNWRVI